MSDFGDFTLSMTRSDNFTFTFQVQLDGVNQDTSNWQKFWLTAKRSTSDSDSAAVFQLTSLLGDGITVVNASTGLYQVDIIPADTSSLGNNNTRLYCDIQGKDEDGNIYTLAKGTITVRTEVTVSAT